MRIYDTFYHAPKPQGIEQRCDVMYPGRDKSVAAKESVLDPAYPTAK